MPTHEHFPLSKREGGKEAVDNAILAHRLCNRIDYSISVGRSYARDLERIRKSPRRRRDAEAERKPWPTEKAQYLLDHQTISDRTWTHEPRLKGEKRDAFIRRILGFPKTP